MKAWGHFCTINRHKMLVMKGCFAVGLIKQGLLHDLSKYSLTEFLVGCKYYQGNMSPNGVERVERGYSSAWLHHKGRNKHHLEYWLDYGIPKREELGSGEKMGICGMKMPVKSCWNGNFLPKSVALPSVWRGAARSAGDLMMTYHMITIVKSVLLCG